MRKKLKMRRGGVVKKYAEGGRVSNEPVGARLGRARQAASEFFTGTGERPPAGGAYSGMTYEEELEEAARARRELEARRAERRAATPPRRSLITNNPVGSNNAANATATRPERAPVATAAAPATAARAVLADSDAQGSARGPTPATQQTDPEYAENAAAGAARLGRVAPPRGTARARPRRREMSADELNDISLSLIRRGNMGPNRPGAETNISRAMGYKKGGKVAAKKGKK